jgi:hypothetical protein
MVHMLLGRDHDKTVSQLGIGSDRCYVEYEGREG